jgi:hypothetical protein
MNARGYIPVHRLRLDITKPSPRLAIPDILVVAFLRAGRTPPLGIISSSILSFEFGQDDPIMVASLYFATFIPYVLVASAARDKHRPLDTQEFFERSLDVLPLAYLERLLGPYHRTTS